MQSHLARTIYKMNISINCITHFSDVLQRILLQTTYY